MAETTHSSGDNVVRWLVEGRILAVYIPPDTHHLVEAYDAEVVHILDESAASLHIVVIPPPDEMKSPPLRVLTNLDTLRHPRLGYVAVIMARTNAVLRFLTQTLSAITGLKVRNFETIDEALNFLATLEQSNGNS